MIIQEEEKHMKSAGNFVTLALVESNGMRVPVMCPYNSFPSVGDIIFFECNGVEKMGDVLFEHCYVEQDDTLWTGLMMACGMEPLRATKIAKIDKCDWRNEDDSEDDSAEKT